MLHPWPIAALLLFATCHVAAAQDRVVAHDPIAANDQVAQDNLADLATKPPASVQEFVETYCLDCHDQSARQGGLAIDTLLGAALTDHTRQWETVVRKLAARQMPPADAYRPSERDYNQVLTRLTGALDAHAQAHPNPGRTETFRRLNRTEYHNAIRDLLALEVDVREMLPADEASHGFDNITVTGLSPVLLERYVSAARTISRLAVGLRAEPASEVTYRIRPDVTQDAHLPGTPVGTRGGTVVRHNFPQAGTYEIQAWLMRDRNEEVEGLRGEHELEFLVDRERVGLLPVRPPRGGTSDKEVDANLSTRVHVSAGPHDVGVVFTGSSASLLESVRQPLNVHFNYYRHPRIGPAVYQFTVRGPYGGETDDDAPSRQRIFGCYPRSQDEEVACAERILTRLARRAYRRDVTAADLEVPLKFFHAGRRDGGFDAGVEQALSAILVNPQFLFRIETDPPGIAPETAYSINSWELASRLSFFLWSSLPDDELLELAGNDRLRQPEVLETQVRRMLADPRSQSLVDNFAAQWLYLRNLDAVIPDMRRYPDFDDNLRQALRKETELFFGHIIREDRSVLELLSADYTFLNERLARHYGIPHIYGSRFRRVDVPADSHRGGLLRQGSILTVTSYATRTSPVIRGHWVLKNLIGSPPPPPPPDVPALEEAAVSADLPVRERLAQHRANETCASCHNLIDPVGFALDNFDAVGRWRETESGVPVSAEGSLPDGSVFVGVAGLEQALLERPDLFVRTLTEKLMTFALGRGVDHDDAPAVRQVVHHAARHDYRFSELVIGIVRSVPFQMRRSP